MKPKGFKNHLIYGTPVPAPPSEEPEVTTDEEDSPEGYSEGDREGELEYPGSDDSVSLVRLCIYLCSSGAAAVWVTNLNCRSPLHPPLQTARPRIVKCLAWEHIPSLMLYDIHLPTRLFRVSSPRSAVHLNRGTMSRLGIFRTFSHSFTPTTTLQLSRVTPSSLLYVALFLIHHWPTLTPLKTNSRIMSFRNNVARRALENVQAYMTRFNIHEIAEYVASAFSYHGEIPFLYCTFRLTDKVEPDLKKEAGGIKVVHSPILYSIGSPYLTADRSAVDFFGIKLSSRRC